MRYRCLKNDTVVLRRHSQHRFDSQLGGQFVLKVATIFTNTRPQSNTPLLDGIVNDSLWEMVPLFDQSFFNCSTLGIRLWSTRCWSALQT